MHRPTLYTCTSELYEFGNLDSYITEYHAVNLDILKNILIADFQGIDSLMIMSTPGNGGTHLLHGFAKNLSKMKKELYAISAERLFAEYELGYTWRLKEITESKHLIIDDYPFFNDKPHFQTWFHKLIEKRIEENKKLAISISTQNSFDPALQAIIVGFGITAKAYSALPSPIYIEKILLNVFERNSFVVSSAVIRYISNLNIKSVREFQLLANSIMALTEKKKKHLSKMSERQFIYQFNKQIKQFTK